MQALLPIDFRVKKTRALRRSLTKEQKNTEAVRVAKKNAAFPARKFAVKA